MDELRKPVEFELSRDYDSRSDWVRAEICLRHCGGTREVAIENLLTALADIVAQARRDGWVF